MKKSLKLKEFIFERIDIALPTFPGKKGVIVIPTIGGKATIYMHKQRKNFVAFRWTINIKSKKIKDKSEFNVFVSIVGIFESSCSTEKDKCKEVEINGPPILYEIIKDNLEKIISNSLIKMKTLPPINFKKIKKRVIS
jgi:preprotein translocase subunit SecB